MMVWCTCSVYGLCGALGAISLGGEIKVYLWKCGRNLGQILRKLPKVSEMATNHWVFL